MSSENNRKDILPPYFREENQGEEMIINLVIISVSCIKIFKDGSSNFD